MAVTVGRPWLCQKRLRRLRRPIDKIRIQKRRWGWQTQREKMFAAIALQLLAGLELACPARRDEKWTTGQWAESHPGLAHWDEVLAAGAGPRLAWNLLHRLLGAMLTEVPETTKRELAHSVLNLHVMVLPTLNLKSATAPGFISNVVLVKACTDLESSVGCHCNRKPRI